MHETFSGSLESAPNNSPEVLELTPVDHSVYPLDQNTQRAPIKGAVPLAVVGQESQIENLNPSAVAVRAGVVSGQLLPLRDSRARKMLRAA